MSNQTWHHVIPWPHHQMERGVWLYPISVWDCQLLTDNSVFDNIFQFGSKTALVVMVQFSSVQAKFNCLYICFRFRFTFGLTPWSQQALSISGHFINCCFIEHCFIKSISPNDLFQSPPTHGEMHIILTMAGNLGKSYSIRYASVVSL